MVISVFDWVEVNVGKGENTGSYISSFFHNVFKRLPKSKKKKTKTKQRLFGKGFGAFSEKGKNACNKQFCIPCIVSKSMEASSKSV